VISATDEQENQFSSLESGGIAFPMKV